MPNITKLLVYAESALSDVQRTFPTLYSYAEKVAVGVTVYVITGPHDDLKKAQDMLARKNHKHDVE